MLMDTGSSFLCLDSIDCQDCSWYISKFDQYESKSFKMIDEKLHTIEFGTETFGVSLAED